MKNQRVIKRFAWYPVRIYKEWIWLKQYYIIKMKVKTILWEHADSFSTGTPRLVDSWEIVDRCKEKNQAD